MIMPSGTSTISSSFLLCDGGAYLQVGTYNNLYNVIGTRYGVGVAGTFKVPNLTSVTTSTGNIPIFYHIKI
jgi:microcystin-dependent protein